MIMPHMVHRSDAYIMVGSFIFCTLLAYKPKWITFRKIPDYVHPDDIAMVAFMLFFLIAVCVLKREHIF